MSIARFDGASRLFGDVVALRDVTLTIEAGQTVGLLGPNGAGKSTLLSLLTGQRKPTSGSVRLFERDPRDPQARTALGSTPQQTALPEALKVGEIIDFVGGHFGNRMSTADLAAEFGLTEHLGRQAGALSGGQQRRVAVALAFVGNPQLVLLDEPTTGLDVDARHALWDVIRRQRERGVTVVVTSHYLEEIEALAERVVVIAGGSVVADDDLRGILARVGSRRVRLRTDDPAALHSIAAGATIEADAATNEFTILTPDSDALVRELVRSNVSFTDLSVTGASLEEAFLTLTADHA